MKLRWRKAKGGARQPDPVPPSMGARIAALIPRAVTCEDAGHDWKPGAVLSGRGISEVPEGKEELYSRSFASRLERCERCGAERQVFLSPLGPKNDGVPLAETTRVSAGRRRW